MNTKRTVKIIKRGRSKEEGPRSMAKSGGGSNIWSKSVRLWISQYRQARAEKLPAFHRLFKDGVSQPVEDPSS